MAIPNLFQKSDANLAGMAYKMAAAQSPADMSRVFERMANSYDRTMKATSQAWGKVIESVTPLVAHATKEFAYNAKMHATGNTDIFMNDNKVNMMMDGFTRMVPNKKYVAPSESDYNKAMSELGGEGVEDANLPTYDEWAKQNSTEPKEVEEHFMGLNEISEGLKKTWTQGKPFSKENRAKRIELQRLKQERFAEIDLIQNGLRSLTQTMTSENYSEQALHLKNNDARLLSAVSSMFNPAGMTTEGDFAGDYIDFSRDNAGRLTLNLYDKTGAAVLKDPRGGGKNSPPVSIPAAELPNLLTPKMTEQSLKPISDGAAAYVEIMSQPGANPEQAKRAFDGRWKQMNLKGKGLLGFMAQETGLYEGQNESIITQVMGNEGKGGNVSATIFTAAYDALPKDTNDNPIVPEGVGIDLGEDGVFNNEDIVRPDEVGAANYTKLVSMLTNPDDNFYNETVTNTWLRETYRGLLDETAKINRGETLAKTSWWGEMSTQAEARSQAVGSNVLAAWQSGDFNNLTLPPLRKGGSLGVLKWIDVDNKDLGVVLKRDGEKDIKFNHKNNKDLKDFMMHEGVLLPHINNMQGFMDAQGNNIFDFSQPLWGSNLSEEQQIFNKVGKVIVR